MITQGNGANPDKGSVYEKLSDFKFNISTNSSSVRIFKFACKSQKLAHPI